MRLRDGTGAAMLALSEPGRDVMLRWVSILLLWASVASAEGEVAGLWVLRAIDAEPFAAHATLSLGADGAISGAAPCNRFSARNLSALPALTVGPIRSTRRACADLSAERRYLALLSRMTQARVAEDGGLVLSGPDGEMRFTPAP